MKHLYVLYDAKCALCRRARIWLGTQPVFVSLVFIPFQSEEVACRFPDIGKFHPEEQLIVVSDGGDVWRGEHAWIMILWALREYREWSQRLAHPALRPLARRICLAISDHRYQLSRWLCRGSEAQFHEVVNAVKTETRFGEATCPVER